MKKKFLLFALAAMMCLNFTACGSETEEEEKETKTKKESVQEEEKESEETEESSEAEAVSEVSEETSEEVVETPEEVIDPMYVHYEPMQEILDADFTDFKFQVDDTIYTVVHNMSFAEFLLQVPERYQMYDQKKNIQIDENRLLEPDKGFVVAFYNTEKGDDCAFSVYVVNETESTISIKDATVWYMQFPFTYEGDCYAPKGIVLNKSRYSQNPVKISEDERFTFSTMKDTLASWGIPEIENIKALDDYAGQNFVAYVNQNDLVYHIFVLDEHPEISLVQGNKAMIRFDRYEIKFTISKETGTISDVRIISDTMKTSLVNPEDYGLSIQ